MINGGTYWSPRRGRHYTVAPLADRFWPKVQKTEGCWLWVGCRDRKGYGQLSGPGRGLPKIKAHRASWILHRGPIPEGMCVLHECDNPQCVRPDHLRLGTLSDNSQDAIARGRNVFQKHPEKHPRGENVCGAKLTTGQVQEIRRLRKAGWTQTRLASVFGVSQAAIWSLLAGETWRLVVAVGRGEVRASEMLMEG